MKKLSKYIFVAKFMLTIIVYEWFKIGAQPLMMPEEFRHKFY